MKRHEFDPTSFVLGLAFAALGLFFVVGDRTAADIGWKWMWPVPLVVLGVLWPLLAKLGLGSLPGDFRVERKGYSFYFPLTTSIIVSIVITLILWIFRR